MRTVRCPYRRTGADIGLFRNRSSSGCIVRTACTTDSATRGKPRAAGGSNGWLRRLLVAVGDQRGVEIVAGVVAAGGDQAGTGVNVLQRPGLALLLAGDLEVLGAGVDGQLDILAVTGANRDHVSVDRLDFSGDMRPADVHALEVKLAVATFVPNPNVAVDLDLGPARLLVAALDHDGGIGPKEGLAA